MPQSGPDPGRLLDDSPKTAPAAAKQEPKSCPFQLCFTSTVHLGAFDFVASIRLLKTKYRG